MSYAASFCVTLRRSSTCLGIGHVRTSAIFDDGLFLKTGFEVLFHCFDDRFYGGPTIHYP